MSSDMENELERTTALRGFRYGLHDFIAQVRGVDVLKKHNDDMEANYLNKSLVDRKTKELLILVACICQRDSTNHMRLHMHAAHKAGASPEEILAVIDLLATWIGGVSKVFALEAWRATFRPDVPTIDRVVELR